MSQLRPGYTPLTHKQVAGKHLDHVFDEINKSNASKLQGKQVTLLQDSWSDVHNHPVIAHSVHIGDSVHFLSAEESKSNKKNKHTVFHSLRKPCQKQLKSLDAKLKLIMKNRWKL